jgi:putative CocE/NonD family hydrolase
MWGQSYGGYVQWAVATDAPSYLKALVPSITGSQLSPYAGSAFGVDTILRWLYNLSRGELPGQSWEDLQRLFNPQIAERAVRPAFAHLPLGEMDASVVGHTLPYYQKWLTHAHLDDAFWKSIRYGTQMDRVSAKVHLVSGWYDILIHQLLDDYEALSAAGHTAYLTIGPWRHPDVDGATEALRAGILWMDAQLKGIHRRLRTRPVRLYIMSAQGGEWQEFDRFPPPSSETRYFLHPAARLDIAAPESGGALPDRYRYDPADPTPSVGGALYHQEGGSRDNRALEARRDVLTYTTAPLATDLEVIGHVRLELFIHSSAVSADFFARLCDVYPDGRSMNVCDGLVRVETQGSTGQPGDSIAIVVDMWATAYRFLRGHRVRLQVSSGAYPRWDRNLGTGEPIRTATRMVTAEQTIYHDPDHPSALVLPVTTSTSTRGM